MDKTISKNVSGFTNNSEASDRPAFVSNRWQPDWPDYTIAIAWPQTPPDSGPKLPLICCPSLQTS